MAKGRTLSLILIAGVMASGAAWVANEWVIKRNAPIVQEIKVEEQLVAIALIDIPLGTKVEEQHVKLISFPKDYVPEGTYESTDLVIGMIAKSDILPEDILREGRFSEHDEGTALASLIEENMRAITVRVDDVIGVGGFLLPGNHVDILATRKVNKRTYTKTVLEVIKILAVDQTARTNDNDPVIVRAVTLEVSPRQAEIVVNSRNEGTIQLSLRNPNDVYVMAVKAKPKKIRKKKVTPPKPTITVIRGTSVGVVSR
ncbi:MAG: Flp pilus assembly protein CpaB [Pseudomonadales bacterium]|nr:Flp pilus assembly protein CpaB [Pseudomonadales bacterium]